MTASQILSSSSATSFRMCIGIRRAVWTAVATVGSMVMLSLQENLSKSYSDESIVTNGGYIMIEWDSWSYQLHEIVWDVIIAI